jgi:ABC-type branched-subunit amino acid transport system ATPase component
MAELLALRDVSAGYGATVVLDNVSLVVEAGSTLAVLGRNGVGKTTLLATIIGHTALHGGSLSFAGRSIAAFKPYRRARLGIGVVPQEREIFASLTVEENLTVAARAAGSTAARAAGSTVARGAGPTAARGAGSNAARDAENPAAPGTGNVAAPGAGNVAARGAGNVAARGAGSNATRGVGAAPGVNGWTVDRIYALFPNLAERRRGMGDQLSGGEQQMLAIGRALMGNPTLLLLDEPLEGLAPVIVDRLLEALQVLRTETHLTMVLTEQHARLALEFSDQAVVLDRGRVVHAAPSAELLASPERLATLIGVAR